MRPAVVVLSLAFCLTISSASHAQTDDLPRPQGRPAADESDADLPPYPEHAPPRPSGDEYKDQDHFWLNDNDGKTQWEDPTWTTTDEEGHETYRDPATGQPLDTKPAEAAWLSLWDDEYEHEFFFNEVTNESRWTLPYSFAWHRVWIDENGTVVPHDEVEAADAETYEDVAPAGEFAGQEPDGEEEGELPEWDPSGSYDEDADGQWEFDGEDPDAHLPPTEEELAEAEILRQEADQDGDVEEL
jgi:hypothetical protein